ncbi:uncharacterized protein LOC129576779 [Sitodiplosis mosellana]|uniref:uncharacterized protein LOC129576779 n=1 Tax=Sitodiplosis mosellana TaxID=263140 RepID=UPI0024447247|nr:uncharacterized protein LOC129576779 [Sitodiplosis mosellana]XP_055318428.1 uncharacterized protein LOC129576779 [Sitodiplosis mosellana]XP_055318429.1 uncharacterized protein LOC129576779 [Sitodiplosis mosellana]XP_055318430.1 uncharacterized protein LOC129576779 [Sitodiplosis mosellana]XP_055318431.1 uncharacterized protein LOC129576779 [Sitodiplosis mosellana]
MGCNTSQEQKSAVTDNNGDIDATNETTNKSARNSAKSEKAKSAKSEKLTNGHDNNKSSAKHDEDKAATRIQALYRGHKVRASMKQGDSSANSNNTKSATSATAESDASNEPTQEELKAEFREDDKELCDAAVRIQAAFRGHLARKTGGDDKDLQEITKKVAEELDIDLNDPELNKAATKIQASFRGHKVRKDTTA